MLREGIAAGERKMRSRLAGMLVRQGRPEDAEVHRDGITVGEPNARVGLAVFFEYRGLRTGRRRCTGKRSPKAIRRPTIPGAVFGAAQRTGQG